jgi:hypothetical protein
MHTRKRRTEDMKKDVAEVEYEHATVEEKMAKYVLLSSHAAHLYLKQRMIPEFVNKTAEWTIKQRKTIDYDTTDDNEEVMQPHTETFPSHNMMRSACFWGLGVDKLKYGSKKHIDFEHLSIMIRAARVDPQQGREIDFGLIVESDIARISLRYESGLRARTARTIVWCIEAHTGGTIC